MRIGDRGGIIVPLAAIYLLFSSSSSSLVSSTSWSSGHEEVQVYRKFGGQPAQSKHIVHNERSGFLGCLYDETVCNNEEYCFNDFLFGRCIPESEEEVDENVGRSDSLTDTEREVLSVELQKLNQLGYSWGDPYTQCLLQELIQALQYRIPFEEEFCNSFINIEENFIPLNQDIKQLSPFDLKDEELENIPLNFEEEPSSLSSPSRDIQEQQNFNPMLNEYYGNLSPEILFRPLEGDSEEQQRESLPQLPYIQFNNEEEEIDPSIFPYEAVKRDEEFDGLDSNDDDETDGNSLIPIREKDFRERQLQTPWIFNDDREVEDEEEAIGRGGNDDDNTYLFPLSPDYFTEEDENEYRNREDRREDEREEREGSRNRGAMEFEEERDLGGGIFNRNERYDVKKPGPFFPNSENNFFLNKLLTASSSVDEEPNNNDKNGNNNLLLIPTANEQSNNNLDQGQVEYEMPILAPVKDKRDLPGVKIAENEDIDLAEDDEKDNYVHVGLKKRINTWQEGEQFIEALAHHFNVPEQALTDKKIESEHVQFRVDPNPQNVNAKKMADKLANDSVMQKRLTDLLGVEVDNAIAGNKVEADIQAKLHPGLLSYQLMVLLVVFASTLLALFVTVMILLLLRRRAKASQAGGGKIAKMEAQEKEKAKVQEEYKELCRDWSRSAGGNGSSSGKGAVAKKTLQSRESKDSEGSNRSSTSSWGEEPSTVNMDISTGHMVLAYMEDHLKNKQRLEQEWVALCGYEAEPCATTVAFKSENKKKNRYPDKLPYDHNRVILNALLNASNSDYINASTVTDHDPRDPSYIVCQGPLAQTVADFWQMIWEQGCVVIVMLTRLQDQDYTLCHRYWPEEGSETYHIFEVHLVSEHVWCDDYLVRSVYLKNTRTGETRTVTQFHFRSWPPHGVPTSTKALLEFRRKVNKSYRGRSCPIAVHCSDGSGRSGTYVLIDMVLNRMAKGCKEIDIAATLEHIRDQRPGMVQTRQQFEFCLMAVAEEVHAILKALPQ